MRPTRQPSHETRQPRRSPACCDAGPERNNPFGCRQRKDRLDSVGNMRADTKRRIAKYWGYILVVVLYFAWFHTQLTPLPLGIMSISVVVYCLFQAPVPCCAQTRASEFCRNNANGLLQGCHLESHKWQNVKMMIRRHSWAQLGRGVFRRISGNAAALSAIAGSVSAVAAVVTLIVKP